MNEAMKSALKDVSLKLTAGGTNIPVRNKLGQIRFLANVSTN